MQTKGGAASYHIKLMISTRFFTKKSFSGAYKQVKISIDGMTKKIKVSLILTYLPLIYPFMPKIPLCHPSLSQGLTLSHITIIDVRVLWDLASEGNIHNYWGTVGAAHMDMLLLIRRIYLSSA